MQRFNLLYMLDANQTVDLSFGTFESNIMKMTCFSLILWPTCSDPTLPFFSP